MYLFPQRLCLVTAHNHSLHLLRGKAFFDFICPTRFPWQPQRGRNEEKSRYPYLQGGVKEPRTAHRTYPPCQGRAPSLGAMLPMGSPSSRNQYHEVTADTGQELPCRLPPCPTNPPNSLLPTGKSYARLRGRTSAIRLPVPSDWQNSVLSLRPHLPAPPPSQVLSTSPFLCILPVLPGPCSVTGFDPTM